MHQHVYQRRTTRHCSEKEGFVRKATWNKRVRGQTQKVKGTCFPEVITPLFLTTYFSSLVVHIQVGECVNICINDADDALLLWPLDSVNAVSSQLKNQTISHSLPRINMYSLEPSWDPESMSDTGCFAVIYWQKYQTLSDGGALRTWPEGQWAAKQIET